MVAGQSSRVFGAFGDAKTKTTCNMTNTLYPQVSNDCVNHFVFFSDDDDGDDDDGDDDDDDDSLPDTMLRLANESV